jgi:hypothetical protein
MPPVQSNNANDKIVKNTVMLYVRMFFNMIVGVCTSRVVLNVLGVEDFGNKRFPELHRDGCRACLAVIQR